MEGSKRDTDVRTDYWTMWEKVRVGWYERIALKHVCILPFAKQMDSASSMHEAGHSKPVLWDNPEG